MGVPTSEVGYNSATARRGDHENSYEHVVALGVREREREGGGEVTASQTIPLIFAGVLKRFYDYIYDSK